MAQDLNRTLLAKVDAGELPFTAERLRDCDLNTVFPTLVNQIKRSYPEKDGTEIRAALQWVRNKLRNRRDTRISRKKRRERAAHQCNELQCLRNQLRQMKDQLDKLHEERELLSYSLKQEQIAHRQTKEDLARARHDLFFANLFPNGQPKQRGDESVAEAAQKAARYGSEADQQQQAGNMEQYTSPRQQQPGAMPPQQHPQQQQPGLKTDDLGLSLQPTGSDHELDALSSHSTPAGQGNDMHRKNEQYHFFDVDSCIPSAFDANQTAVSAMEQ
eukprot:Clim_evm4s222 gene=Clim_evmTU4s222